jgi:LUD domain
VTDRARFLGRVRDAAAIGVPSPRRPLVAVGLVPPPVEFAAVDPGISGFRTALGRVGGESYECADVPTARAHVLDIAGGRAPVLLSSELDVESLQLDGLRWPDCGIAAASDAAVSVVGCVALVAATGSVVVDARSARGRSLSLLSPICIVIARASCLVATPGDVLRSREAFWPGEPPSQVLLITGPSRSADIEMTLTRGVHGPAELHVVILDA